MLRQLLLAFCFVCSAWGASLEWNASVVDETHAAPTGYRIHRGTAPGVYDWQVDVGLVLQWPIPDNLYGSYYWAASAYNAIGSSGYSNEVYWQRAPPEPPQYVGATNLRASKLQQQSEQPMAIDLSLAYTNTTRDYRSTITINKPTGVVDGDFLIGVIWAYGNVPTAPAGWELIASHVHSDRGDIYVYYKRASSEGASWGWTISYDLCWGIVWRLTGIVASGGPEDCAEDTSETDYDNNDLVNQSITTVTAGAAVIQIGCNVNETFGSHTLTNRISLNSGQFVIDADIQASAGATGDKTLGGKSDWDRSTGILIALTPASGGGSSAVPVIMRSYRARRN